MCQIIFFQFHQAVGRAINVIEDEAGFEMPPHILDGYIHFESLSRHNYEFSCLYCGVNPVILVLDANRKAAFKLAGMFKCYMTRT